MVNLGLPEMIVLVGAALMLFGPNKIPELARSLGEATRQYRKGLSSAKKDLMNEFEGNSEPSKPQTEEDQLIATAKTYGIPTEGRQISEIAQDILNHTNT